MMANGVVNKVDAYRNTIGGLRMVAIVKKGEYLSPDANGVIQYVVQTAGGSAITPAIWGATWKSNSRALKTLCNKNVPALVKVLIEEKKAEELIKLDELIRLAKDGLQNLKTIFDLRRHAQYIACLDNDLDKQRKKITEYLNQ